MSQKLKSGGVAERSEIMINAVAVSRGFAVGNAVCLYGRKRQFFRVKIHDTEIINEIERFRIAVASARKQLDNFADLADKRVPLSSRGIFEFHQLILSDPVFAEAIEAVIVKEKVNAEWAVKAVGDKQSAEQRLVSDPGAKEKFTDIDDVVERVLNNLSETCDPLPNLGESPIVVASIVRPSTLIEFARRNIAGLITEHGGWTSHSFIMAREIGIPAVTGMKDVFRTISNGDRVGVNGFNGTVYVNPSAETVNQLRSDNIEKQSVNSRHSENSRKRVATLDDREIVLRANVEKLDSPDELRAADVDGIGLLRTEYLFPQMADFPSEEDQAKAYRKIVEQADGAPVRIRTFDVNADQFSFSLEKREGNPSLGLRAIRLSLAKEPEFRAQIRAILTSVNGGTAEIVLPMVTGVDELLVSKRLISEERERIAELGIMVRDVRLGAMIEVPSAVLTIADIVKVVDFICLGSNDLVQYLLAVDRDNESVADWYQTLHPAVITAIASVVNASLLSGTPLTVCGEMAGSPFYTPLLVGLGVQELSMNLSAVPAVRDVITGISFDDTVELARMVSASSSSSTSESIIRNFFAEHWDHLNVSQLQWKRDTQFELSPKN